MLNLLIDLSYTQNAGNVVTGIHLYGKELARKISRADDVDLTVSLLKGAAIDDFILQNERIKIVYINSPKNSKKYWRELSAICDRFDAVFFPYQIIDGKVQVRKARLYMTIHDLTPLREVRVDRMNKYERLYKTGWKQKLKYAVKCVLRFSRLWYLKRNHYLKQNVRTAYRIFTVSEYSKSDILRTYHLPSQSVVVAYATAGKDSAQPESELKYENFYLLVSAGRYLKNAHMALLALDDLWESGEETRPAVVTGVLPESVRKRLRHTEKVVSLNYVKDGDLEYLYKNAYCFIFPSLSEGFGLPPAEAMKYGTRTICSDAMSLKELYHETILFDPYSKESIKKAINRIDELQPEQMKKIYRTILQGQQNACNIVLETLMKD